MKLKLRIVLATHFATSFFYLCHLNIDTKLGKVDFPFSVDENALTLYNYSLVLATSDDLVQHRERSDLQSVRHRLLNPL